MQTATSQWAARASPAGQSHLTSTATLVVYKVHQLAVSALPTPATESTTGGVGRGGTTPIDWTGLRVPATLRSPVTIVAKKWDPGILDPGRFSAQIRKVEARLGKLAKIRKVEAN